jgi:predicted secreted protein
LPSEKIAGYFQQAGKKEGGLGEGIFARLLTAPKARQGREAARPCVSKEAKPAKIDSLIEKEFCARPLKKEIFAGFVRRQAASRWGGFLPVRAEVLAQKRFALRSVIATNRCCNSMKIVIDKCSDNLAAALRKIGYTSKRGSVKTGEISAVRVMARGGFPRFHIYAKIEGNNLYFNLHLDQKRPSYSGVRAHSGEHESQAVKQEANRIKTLL